MSRANGIISKLNAALQRTQPFDRTVYLRTVTISGGDPLIGRPGSVQNTDTLITPQPFVERLGRERIPGGHAYAQTLTHGSAMQLADDYNIICSSTAITRSQLEQSSTFFVFKDANGGEEVLSLIDFETASLNTTDIMFTVYARSVSRPGAGK